MSVNPGPVALVATAREEAGLKTIAGYNSKTKDYIFSLPSPSARHDTLVTLPVFISLITRMRYKRDIKMGRLCTPGGAVIGIVGGGVTFRFYLVNTHA